MRYSSFMDWVDETCRLMDDTEEIEIDPASDSFADDCFGNSHMLQLQKRLSEGSVGYLTLRNLVVGPKGGAWLQAVLHGNPGLLALSLEDTTTTTTTTMSMNEEGTPDTGQSNNFATGIALGLQANRCLERLNLRGNQIHDSSVLGHMLSKNNTLLDLRLCHNRLDFRSSQALCAGLKGNTTLQMLDLTGNHMDDGCVSEIMRGMHHHSSIHFLCLDFNNFGQKGVTSIATMLQNNTILEVLHLFGNHIDEEGGRQLGMALQRNIRLSTLTLSFNDLGDRGAAHLADSLVTNTTLSKLWMPANRLGNAGLRAFAERLPFMRGLTQLNVGDYFDNEAAAEVLKTIPYNKALRVFHMESVLYDDENIERQINFYVRLNRAGRSLLCDPSVLSSLWPHILHNADVNLSHEESSCPDVLYCLLREKPDLLAAG